MISSSESSSIVTMSTSEGTLKSGNQSTSLILPDKTSSRSPFSFFSITTLEKFVLSSIGQWIGAQGALTIIGIRDPPSAILGILIGDAGFGGGLGVVFTEMTSMAGDSDRAKEVGSVPIATDG